jgi:hypothetical protein
MRQAHIGTIRTQNSAGNLSQILTLQASIYGMPFDEWGDPGTTYRVAYCDDCARISLAGTLDS